MPKNVTELWTGMGSLVEIFKSLEHPGGVSEDELVYQRVAVHTLPNGSIVRGVCQNPAKVGLYGHIKSGNKSGTVRISWQCKDIKPGDVMFVGLAVMDWLSEYETLRDVSRHFTLKH